MLHTQATPFLRPYKHILTSTCYAGYFDASNLNLFMVRFIKNLEFFRSCLIAPQERPHNHRIANDNSSNYNTLLILHMFTQFLNIHPASRASFCFLGCRGEKKTLLESRQTFEIAAARTSHPRRPRGSQSDREKRRDERF